jgi:hypothetical protein
MTYPGEVSVVRTTAVKPAPPPRARPFLAWAVGGVLLALAVAGALATRWQLQSLTTELDARSLELAGALLNRTIDQQKADLLAEVRVLSEDTRVRTTVMTAEFSEATVRDVLEDLRKLSGASVMGVLDVGGKVKAVAGSDSLRGMNLGASPIVGKALEQAVTTVWTFPDQVLVIALAPVRSGGQAAALFLSAHQLDEGMLAPIEHSLGVAGTVVIRDKIAASSSRSPAVSAVVQAAMGLEDGQNHLVNVGGGHMVRLMSTSQSAGAGRVAWVVPTGQYGAHVLKLQLLGGLSIVLVALSLLLALWLFSQANRQGPSLG